MANAVTSSLTCKLAEHRKTRKRRDGRVSNVFITVETQRAQRGEATHDSNHVLVCDTEFFVQFKLGQTRPHLAQALFARFREAHRVAWDEPGREERRDEVALEEFARGRHGCELKISLANWQFTL